MFISTNRFNPCPICADIKGKCRSKLTSFTLPNQFATDDQQFFCMAIREEYNGYKFTGETSDRLWGKFVSYNLSQSLSHAWSRNNRNHPHRAKQKIIKRPRPPSIKFKPSYRHLLRIEQRHQAIASVLSQLSLTPAHRKALIERGFTDQQIKQCGFKSAGYKQPLTNAVSNRLAGVS